MAAPITVLQECIAMASHELLRDLGLFDARAPRYTSYPPANHFKGGVGPDQVTPS